MHRPGRSHSNFSTRLEVSSRAPNVLPFDFSFFPREVGPKALFSGSTRWLEAVEWMVPGPFLSELQIGPSDDL